MNKLAPKTLRIIEWLSRTTYSQKWIAKREGCSATRINQINRRYGIRRGPESLPLLNRDEMKQDLKTFADDLRSNLRVYEVIVPNRKQRLMFPGDKGAA